VKTIYASDEVFQREQLLNTGAVNPVEEEIIYTDENKDKEAASPMSVTNEVCCYNIYIIFLYIYIYIYIYESNSVITL
jgi:hypothetical protein